MNQTGTSGVTTCPALGPRLALGVWPCAPSQHSVLSVQPWQCQTYVNKTPCRPIFKRHTRCTRACVHMFKFSFSVRSKHIEGSKERLFIMGQIFGLIPFRLFVSCPVLGRILDKGDYPENLHTVCLCPNKQALF